MSDLIKIDKEFQKLIPPLTEEEYTQLEENILAEGCRDALVLWNGTIVDGHNRYKICTENDIPFVTEDKEFSSRDEAKEWIIRNQLGRRNLPSYKMVELALKLKPMIQARAKENVGGFKGNQYTSGSSQKSDTKQKIRTDDEIAKIARVSKDTVRKVEIIQNEGTEEQIDRAREGGKGNSINAIYGEIEQAKIPTKTCKHCNKTMESDKFLPGKNVCRECDNRIRRKPQKVEQSQEPTEEIDPRFKIDLYDLSTVPEYTIDFAIDEIEGSRENLIYIVDNLLEEREELMHQKENATIFNKKIYQIITELKERLIDEERAETSKERD